VDAGAPDAGADGGAAPAALLTSAGPVYCWGGDGTRAKRVQVSINDAVQVSVGVPTCVLRARGSVACWGDNSAGEVGDGTTTSRENASAVSGLSDAVMVATSRFREASAALLAPPAAGFACALRMSGAVSCWGANDFGQLGNGNTTERHTPTLVNGLGPALSLALGARHACALLQGGAVSCWGANDHGQLGNSSRTDSSRPVRVTGIADAIAVSVAQDHSCALLTSGQVTCWGRNDAAQLGIGAVGSDRTTPQSVAGLTGAVLLAAGANHSCAATADSVLCWGADDHDQTGAAGAGLQTRASLARQVGSVSELSAGAGHTCAVTAGSLRRVLCWGDNSAAQLGSGSLAPSTVPRSVRGLP